MKKLPLLAVFIAASFTNFAQVGIGTTNPDPSAILDIKATGIAVGLLFPRLSETNRNTYIKSPSQGLVIYNRTTEGLEVVISGGLWYAILDGSTSAVATGTTSNIGGVGIGTNTPDPNAILDVVSSNKGVLLPMAATDPNFSRRGMIYYNTTDDDVKLYNGSNWLVLTN
jgi:hypothetical protein